MGQRATAAPRRDAAVLLWPALFATDSLALGALGKGVWTATARPEKAFQIIEGPRRPSVTNREENRPTLPQLCWRRSLSLAEPGRLAVGMGYGAVAQALTRFGRRMERSPKLRQKMARIQKQMWKSIAATPTRRLARVCSHARQRLDVQVDAVQ